MHIDFKLMLGVEGDVDYEDARELMINLQKWIRLLDLKRTNCAATLTGTLEVDRKECITY